MHTVSPPRSRVDPYRNYSGCLGKCSRSLQPSSLCFVHRGQRGLGRSMRIRQDHGSLFRGTVQQTLDSATIRRHEVIFTNNQKAPSSLQVCIKHCVSSIALIPP
ncbi:hypothetical protein J1614_008022 [Plenodomus biglobosus]|nr:hypothetical protein J1614_008022 [Plenodomus biglobosus]